MADDGLLVNFDIGDGILKSKPVYKGGSWKARNTARRIASGRGKKSDDSTKGANDTPVGDRRPITEPRPAKRQRVDDHGEAFAHRTHVDDQRGFGGRSQTSQAPKQFISSLFTYNPKSSKVQEPEAEETNNVEPSNAPLKSELDTFTSLSLSTALATHLLKKMDLKAPTAIQKAAISQLLKDDSDAFIQAETGSGKTLAYLLPIVQRVMALSSAMKEQATGSIHRDSGLFAIILAPTRELSKQISVVLENLRRSAHWIVSGTVVGGEKKKSEKARLRKGLNILVATPGRLADHLEHTEALDVSNVRWLVLDEGDRLMELGFEKEIQKIVSQLNLRMKAQKGNNIPGLPTKRTTVLCSATMKVDVERLGEISLKNAVHIQASRADMTEDEIIAKEQNSKFTAPSQLQQSYAVVPAKLRLVTLIATLKRAFSHRGSVMKAIVFLSCADSVDFHFKILSRSIESDSAKESPIQSPESSDNEERAASKPSTAPLTSCRSLMLSASTHNTHVHRLHGSLAQSIRTSTLTAFTRSSEPSLLICTDVASRGLDVPNIDLVIEYDPAFSHEDHLHRIGRTARAGRAGRSIVFLMPGPEEGYAEFIRGDARLVRHEAEQLLQRAFGSGLSNKKQPKGPKDWEQKATDVQLGIERWVLDDDVAMQQAKRAFQSHVRAYATHVVPERGFFDVKELHLGHLAKAFALRDRPGGMGAPGMRERTASAKGRASRDRALGSGGNKESEGKDSLRKDEDEDETGIVDMKEAAKKMRAKMRANMAGASEFNLG